MATTASVAAQKMVGFLRDPNTGIAPVVLQIADDTGVPLPLIPPANIFNQNVAFDLAEKAQALKYPVIYVYTDRVKNSLTEKFRKFSGTVRTVAEVRISQDRIEGIEERVRLYVEGVTQVLEANRGSWGQGGYYTGGYDVTFEPVRHGGKNYIQAAKVSFEVDFSQ